ncbi:MAG TPA: tyrosine--tRNA ligase [Candidatus Paceibacterota bacterium]|nr:tyrosine--tRNA ligase [Candidatus Paceibacterota bacterium]
MNTTDKLKELDNLFTKGVGEFVDPEGKFRQKLTKKIKNDDKEEIIIKFGIDPTKPDIHLGHAVVFQKLRKFQDLGCKVVFVVGDFTARIGDPTGKSQTRPELDQLEIQKNVDTYNQQVGKILNLDPKVYSWIRNSDWFYNASDVFLTRKNSAGEEERVTDIAVLTKALIDTRMQKTALKRPGGAIDILTVNGLMWTLKHITFSKLVSRDMFQERIKKNQELYMHEMLYPVFQGIDSYLIHRIYNSCDLEIGGTDQTFNMMMGRDVMKANGQPPQAVMTCKILPGTDGKEKMSKSLNNYIGISEAPSEIFGKIMSIPDSVISDYFELCTFSSVEEVKKELSDKNVNPRDLKLRLGEEIVYLYHGKDAAREARDSFLKTFSEKKGMPEAAPEVRAAKEAKISDVLIEAKIVSSRSDFRRLISEAAIKDMKTGAVVALDQKVESDMDLKVGKHRFLKIRVR